MITMLQTILDRLNDRIDRFNDPFNRSDPAIMTAAKAAEDVEAKIEAAKAAANFGSGQLYSRSNKLFFFSIHKE